MIEAALRDERVCQARLTAFGEGLGSKGPCSLPIAGLDLDQRHGRETLRYFQRKLWIAQDFGKYRRNHQHLAVR